MRSKMLIITWLTFHEALRRRMVVAALGLGVLFVLVYDLGLLFLQGEARSLAAGLPGVSSAFQDQMFSFVFSVGLYIVHFLTIMLAIFASVDSISGEIRSHTVQTIVT